MASTDPPLWSVTLRKEAFDLMAAIWSTLGEVGQDRLLAHILDGPPEPEAVDAKENETEHFQRRRDRAVFERLEILRRVGTPKLPAYAYSKLEELKLRHPDWQVRAGDEAHFTFWTESASGYRSDYEAGELKQLSGPELLQTLRETGNRHDGRLHTWKRLVEDRPGRGIGVLRMLAADPARDDGDLWGQTLFGLREAISRPAVARRLFDILAKAPDHYLRARDVLSGACDLLEKASKRDALAINERLFWKLWDRLFDGALNEGDASGLPQDDDWLHRAINRPIGDLATALLNVMFRRGLRAGQGLPDDLRPRFERLAASDTDVLRLGRVILASRLYYLFAVDPGWMADRFIPFFDWGQSEDEAAALWCSYAWQPRIDADLWAALKFSFFDAFTPERLARLGTSAKNIANLLMVVGVEFLPGETPAGRAREAIYTMTPELRGAAAFWLYSYLAGPKSQEPQTEVVEVERAARADRLWYERVAPWLKRVWPRDRNLIETSTSEAFALLVIATREAFNDAVAMLQPFIGKTPSWGRAIHNLRNSTHPDRHAQSSLKLIDRLVILQNFWFADDLREVLDRIAASDPKLREDAAFRSLDEELRATGY